MTPSNIGSLGKNEGITIGIIAFIAIGLGLIFFLPISESKTIILQTPSGTDSCVVDFVLAQNLTDLCDVTIITPTSGQIIRYNGSQWVNVASSVIGESTVCNNLGSGVIICAGGNVNLKSLLEGSGIDITSNGTNIMIASTVSGESTACTNTGTGNGLCNGGNVQIKSLIAGSGITISDTTDDYTIINASPESTTCNNVGTGNQLCSGGNVNIDTLIAGTGITITDTTDDWTFDNTGVISNTCSLGIVCSGTNPSTFTADWQLLCSAAGAGSSLSCSSFPARTYLHVSIIYVSGSGGTAMTPSYQFNSDTGTNYSWRNSNNGGADTTAVSTSSCTVRGSNSIGSNGGGLIILDIENVSALRKIIRGNEGSGLDASAATASSKNDNTCKWDNSASQITTITLTKTGGTNDYATGTQISVWGHN